MVASHKIPESVLVVVFNDALDVLLIERADRRGFWQSVTGSKDYAEEALAETARREVAEETGIAVGSDLVPLDALSDWQTTIAYEIYPVWRHRYAPGVTQNVEHWFGLLVPRGIDILLAPREHVDHVWLPVEEAAARCFSASNRAAILQVPQRLAQRREETGP